MNYVIRFTVAILSTKNATGNNTDEAHYIFIHGIYVQTSINNCFTVTDQEDNDLYCFLQQIVHLLQQMDIDGWIHGQYQREKLVDLEIKTAMQINMSLGVFQLALS